MQSANSSRDWAVWVLCVIMGRGVSKHLRHRQEFLCLVQMQARSGRREDCVVEGWLGLSSEHLSSVWVDWACLPLLTALTLLAARDWFLVLFEDTCPGPGSGLSPLSCESDTDQETSPGCRGQIR